MKIWDLCIDLTNRNSKTCYTVVDGKLCVKHYLLLQQLLYRKKLKDNTFKEYCSYHVKFPRVVYELLNPVDGIVYLEHVDNRIIIHRESDDSFKKIRIQKSRSDSNIIYQLTVPRIFLKLDDYKSGESIVVCQVIAADNDDGYLVWLELM